MGRMAASGIWWSHEQRRTRPTVPLDHGGDRMTGQADQLAEIPSFSGCVVGYDYDDPTHVLYDSRYVKRATAISQTAGEHGGDFKDHRCETVYARWMSPQEIWDYGAGERWWDDRGEMVEGHWVPLDDGSTMPPDEPPAGWEPDLERDPSFELCGKDAPGAVKVWKVETGR
jgi:hypothetical protein